MVQAEGQPEDDAKRLAELEEETPEQEDKRKKEERERLDEL